jgi:hypothetical protein
MPDCTQSCSSVHVSRASLVAFDEPGNPERCHCWLGRGSDSHVMRCIVLVPDRLSTDNLKYF